MWAVGLLKTKRKKYIGKRVVLWYNCFNVSLGDACFSPVHEFDQKGVGQHELHNKWQKYRSYGRP